MKKLSKAMYGKSMMKKGGSSKMKKYNDGGGVGSGFERRQDRKIQRAQTRAEIAAIEGEGTVAQKRNNTANRISQAIGTSRAKTPKTVSTSTSTSTSNTDNRNSGNTNYNTNNNTSSGSNSGSSSNSGSRSTSNSSSGSSSSSRSNIMSTKEPSKMMKGGAFKMKKYNDGGQKGPRMFDPADKKTAMKALGVDKGKTGKYDPSNFAPIPTTKTTTKTTKKYGGTAKPKMMKGGAKKK